MSRSGIRVGEVIRGKNGQRFWVDGPVEEIIPLAVAYGISQNPSGFLRMFLSWLFAMALTIYISITYLMFPPDPNFLVKGPAILVGLWALFWFILWIFTYKRDKEKL